MAFCGQLRGDVESSPVELKHSIQIAVLTSPDKGGHVGLVVAVVTQHAFLVRESRKISETDDWISKAEFDLFGCLDYSDL